MNCALDLNKIENLSIKRLLDRNTAEIPERSDTGILVRDTVGGAYMLADNDPDEGRRWLTGHSSVQYGLTAICNVERGNILIGSADGTDIGFIGEHPEGSVGLLHILPRFRRMGYARELESVMIEKTLQKGYIPFCQIMIDNYVSMHLQEKLGLEGSEQLIGWFWKE